MAQKELGHEHYEIYKDGFHDRLGAEWPEPKEQLHSGGWDWTHKMIDELDLTRTNIHSLDLCCGEGSTAVFIAARYGGRVTGIDIVPSAIETAKKAAKEKGVENLATFVQGNIFKLPFADETFDVVYGQDPDGLSHPQRVHALKEIYRVLKPGGVLAFHHHWIAGFNFSETELKRLGDQNDRLTADHYVEDVQEAGFHIRISAPIYELAEKHLLKVAEMKKEKGKSDAWLEDRVRSIERGHKFGVRIKAIKPLTPPPIHINDKLDVLPSILFAASLVLVSIFHFTKK